MAFLWKLKLWWAVRRYAARVVRLFFDRRVSPGLKLLTVLGAIVAVSPLDLLSDVPILGAFDDAALLAIIAMLFVRFSPADVVAEYFGGPRTATLKNVTPGAT
jgi:uncharacterized membrane protein YkvA (DUF1232 family)